MKIEYYHKNIESLGDGAREYIENKVGSFEKLTDVRDVYIEISQRKDGDFYLNVSVRAKNGSEYRAEEKSQTIHACIDIIEDEIMRQIRHDREKTRDLKRRGGRSIKKKLTIDDSARL